MLMLIYVTVLYIRPQEWTGSPLYAWQAEGWGIMDILTILVCAAAVIKRVNEGGRVMRSATDWFVLGVFGAALWSQVVHFDTWMVRATFEEFGKVILLYFLIVNIVDSRVKLKVFVVLIVSLTAFMAVHGVLQVHTGAGFGGQTPMLDQGQPRIMAYGIFEDPNDLGLTLVVAMPVLLMGITASHAMVVRLLSLGVLLLCGYGLYLTNSRGAMVALAVMAFVYFYKRFGKVLSVVLGTALLMGIIFYGPSRIQTMSDDPSGSGRREVWSEGLQMLKARPPLNAMFGVGWAMFIEHEDQGKTAHNSFLLAVTEMGVVGLFCFLGAFYVPLRDLHRLTLARPEEEAGETDRKRLQRDQALARALIASVMGFAVAAFFLSRTYNQVPYVLIAVCAALARLAKTEAAGEPALPEAGEERLLYDFYRPDFYRLSLGTLATVPIIYVVCRVLWRA